MLLKDIKTRDDFNKLEKVDKDEFIKSNPTESLKFMVQEEIQDAIKSDDFTKKEKLRLEEIGAAFFKAENEKWDKVRGEVITNASSKIVTGTLKERGKALAEFVSPQLGKWFLAIKDKDYVSAKKALDEAEELVLKNYKDIRFGEACNKTFGEIKTITPGGNAGFIPTVVTPYVADALRERSFIRNYAHLFPFGHTNTQMPRVTAHGVAAVRADAVAAAASDPTTDQVDFTLHNFSRQMIIANEFLAETQVIPFPFLEWVFSELAYSVAYLETYMFLHGNGVNAWDGVLNETMTTITDNNTNLDTLLRAEAQLGNGLYNMDWEGSEKFVSSSMNRFAFRSRKSTAGGYYWPITDPNPLHEWFLFSTVPSGQTIYMAMKDYAICDDPKQFYVQAVSNDTQNVAANTTTVVINTRSDGRMKTHGLTGNALGAVLINGTTWPA